MASPAANTETAIRKHTKKRLSFIKNSPHTVFRIWGEHLTKTCLFSPDTPLIIIASKRKEFKRSHILFCQISLHGILK